MPGARKLAIMHSSRVSRPTAKLVAAVAEPINDPRASLNDAFSGTCLFAFRRSELYKSLYGIAVNSLLPLSRAANALSLSLKSCERGRCALDT